MKKRKPFFRGLLGSGRVTALSPRYETTCGQTPTIRKGNRKRLLPQRVLHPTREISPLWGWRTVIRVRPFPRLSSQTFTGSSVIFNP